MTSWTLSDEPPVPTRQPDQAPPARHHPDPRVRASVVDALKELLQRAEGGRFDIAEESSDGVAMVLEHANVRCVLVVQAPGPRHSLSPRESQIACLIADGATNRLIASVLDISLWTVSTHIRRIFAKLGVNSRAEMVAQLFGASHHRAPTDQRPTRAEWAQSGATSHGPGDLTSPGWRSASGSSPPTPAATAGPRTRAVRSATTCWPRTWWR